MSTETKGQRIESSEQSNGDLFMQKVAFGRLLKSPNSFTSVKQKPAEKTDSNSMFTPVYSKEYMRKIKLRHDQEIAGLERNLRTLSKSLEEASTQIDSLKKQKEGLLAENNALSNQLRKTKEKTKEKASKKKKEESEKMQVLGLELGQLEKKHIEKVRAYEAEIELLGKNLELEQLEKKHIEKVRAYEAEIELLGKENQDLIAKIDLLEEVIFESEVAKKQGETQRNMMVAELQGQMENEIALLRQSFQKTIQK